MTVKSIVPRQQARSDIDAAIEHYASSAGEEVALGFIDALEDAYRLIANHPAAGSPLYGHELGVPGLRHRRLTRYPYLVFYVDREAHVDVWRVLHAQRDIPAWMQEPEK